MDGKNSESIFCEDLADGKGIRALGYVRVSTERQAEHGFSLEAQINELRELAKRRGSSRFYHIVDAGKSGVDFDKRSLNRILELAERKEIDEVLVVDIDRIGRNCRKLMEFFLDLRDYGVVVVTPAGEMDVDELTGLMMAALRSWAAQYENERRACASVAGRIQAFLNRRWNKPLPFGYRRKGEWIEKDPAWEPIIRDTFDLFKRHKSYGHVTDAINKKYSSQLSKPITPQQISKIVGNPAYAGKPTYSGNRVKKQSKEEVAVEDPSLTYVDSEMFREVQRIIRDIHERHRKAKRNRIKELIRKHGYGVMKFLEPDVAVICPICKGRMVFNGLVENGNANLFLCQKCRKQLRVPKRSQMREIEKWAAKQEKLPRTDSSSNIPTNRKNKSFKIKRFDDIEKCKKLVNFVS